MHSILRSYEVFFKLLYTNPKKAQKTPVFGDTEGKKLPSVHEKSMTGFPRQVLGVFPPSAWKFHAKHLALFLQALGVHFGARKKKLHSSDIFYANNILTAINLRYSNS